MLKIYSICIAIVLLLSGCAMTNDVTPLYYQPNVTGGKSAQSSATLSVGKFTDSRGVTDSRMLARKENMNYDETSGMYLAEMPITEVLEYGIKTGLSDAGYKIADNSRYVLRGNLLRLDFQYIPGMWTVNLQANMQVEFTLVDKHSGTQIWNQTYRGFAVVKNNKYPQSFNAALDNLIVNLLNSSEFRNALH